MNPSGPAWLPCPVCDALVAGPAPCPSCGLPAAGQAALVMARIGATLAELARDRETLLASLRASAPGYGTAAGYAAAPPVPPVAPVPPAPPVAPTAAPAPAGVGRVRRLTPQQVLLALGALLLVAGAMTFVALGWSRLGLAFQAGVMAVVTAAACAASAWTAGRGLRATEEALAGAGAALLAVDLGAAYDKNLFGIDVLPLRLWAALACGVAVVAALALGRATRSTVTWPLVALLAGQPVVLLLLPPGLVDGPAGVAALFAVAAVDVAAALRLRAAVAPVAAVLAGLGTLAGAAEGLAVAASADPLRSWPATATLAVAGVALQFLVRAPRVGHRLRPAVVAAAGGAVTGAALAWSCDTVGPVGLVVAAVLGLLAASAAAVLMRSAVLAAAATAAGAGLLCVSGAGLAGDGRNGTLALVVLGLAAPALLTAVLRPALRAGAAGVAVLAPVGAVLLAHDGGQLATTPAGLLLALVAAAAFAAATLRARAPEEPVVAAAGTVAGFAAAAVGGSAHAWGQVGVELAITGAAAGCYAVVARRHWVAALAVADLVLAAWIALAGAAVGTPEAYTLPAAAGLLLVAVSRLRAGAGSWSAEGPAAAVAVVPSALLAVSQPTVLRLVLVVAGALALTVAGTLTHRQAPFVVGAGSLAFVVLTRLGPYAPLLPRWLVLAAAGLVLLAVGATYERRRQQAREAVAWVAHMR